mgnify:CR=1 FL=1|tara:strand:+ start:2101 stop:3186 length:1086 start_codon:yes stop_codon:yes gene_type:complete
MQRVLLGQHSNTELGSSLFVSRPGQNVVDANTWGGNLSFSTSADIKTTSRVLQTGIATIDPGRPKGSPNTTIDTWTYGYGVQRVDIPFISKPDHIDIPEVLIFMAWANSVGAYHPYYANTYQETGGNDGFGEDPSAEARGHHVYANLWFANTRNSYECASVDTEWFRYQGLSHILQNPKLPVADWTAQSQPNFASGVRWGCNTTWLSINAYFTPTFSYVGPNAQNATSLEWFNYHTGARSWPNCIGEHRINKTINAGADEEVVINDLGLGYGADHDNCGEQPAYLNFHNGISNNQIGHVTGNIASDDYGFPYINEPQTGDPPDHTCYGYYWGMGMQSSHTILKVRYIVLNQEAGKWGSLNE